MLFYCLHSLIFNPRDVLKVWGALTANLVLKNLSFRIVKCFAGGTSADLGEFLQCWVAAGWCIFNVSNMRESGQIYISRIWINSKRVQDKQRVCYLFLCSKVYQAFYRKVFAFCILLHFSFDVYLSNSTCFEGELSKKVHKILRPGQPESL